MSKSRAIALLSGGLDSAVAVGTWLGEGRNVDLALTFDYGQRAAAAEAAAARRLAARWGIAWRPLPMPWLAEAAAVAGSALVEGGPDLPRGTVNRPGDETSAAAVWVPARNVVLVAIAASLAEARGAGAVLVGFNREEAATFPDNSAEFVQAMDEVLRLGTRRRVAVVSPTLAWDKREIVACARRLGLAAGDVWSCYGSGPEPCGVCESCARARAAWGN